MEDYSAIVTGGAQGIGKAIAKALLDAGAFVVLLDADARAAREAVAEFNDAGAERAHCVVGSAADDAAVRKAVGIARKLGRGLHMAIANAGVSRFTPLARLGLKEWNAVLAINLTGGFLLAKHCAPHLAKSRGAMVLIASTRALQSEADTLAYSASKGGVVALAHSLAVSLAPEVRVNCVSPGWIATEEWQRSDRRRKPQLSRQDHAQHPAGRVGTPEDVAKLVRYLLSADAGFITGANFVIDGGMTRKMIYS